MIQGYNIHRTFKKFLNLQEEKEGIILLIVDLINNCDDKFQIESTTFI